MESLTAVQALAYNVKQLWDLGNLRVSILLSLFIHAFLAFFESVSIPQMIRWAYFVSDWIAAYALGQAIQISMADIYDADDHNIHRNDKKNGDLFLFWAQFLLVHLSSPDKITSFTPGENSLWFKQLFELTCQIVVTVYSFCLLAIFKKIDNLLIPTILLFIVGVIKSFERVKALLKVRFDLFGEFTSLLKGRDFEIDYEELVKNYRNNNSTAAVEENENERSQRPLDDQSVHSKEKLRDVGKFLNEFNFKVLFTGSLLSSSDREKGRQYFREVINNSDQAEYSFEIIEYELKAVHDLMHTKVAVLQNTQEYISRFICFLLVLVASIFFFTVEKQGSYTNFDINLTTALIIATLAFDIISFIKLVFSEWSVLTRPKMRRFIPSFLSCGRQIKTPVLQYNMFDLCLYKGPTELLYTLAENIFDLTSFLDRMRAMWFRPSTGEKVTAELKQLIFKELKNKSDHKDSLKDAMEACKDRGLWALSHDSNDTYKRLVGWSIEEFHYTESLLLWHLATELCCDNLIPDQDHRNFPESCTLISNFMFYLIVTRSPAMVSLYMDNWDTVFHDTQKEAKRFFKKHKKEFDHKKPRRQLFAVETPVRPSLLKENKSKSLLFEACYLAKQLRDIGEQRWDVMGRVWVELISFAAINCSPIIHAQQPDRGGELLTIIWLLMYHLGLGTQFSEKIEREIPITLP